MVNLGGGSMLNDDVIGGSSSAFDANATTNMADNGGSSTNSDGKSSDGGDRQQIQSRTPTMPGVLHFLQHEWSRFEMDRAQWEMERAELQARISFLQGERKGQENLKQDLVRRIKMLEYSLKQERAKNYRLTHNGQEPELMDTTNADDNQEKDAHVPLDVDSVSTQPNSNLSWRQGRQLLRQYLQEIGYSETILDVRSFRVKSLLGMLPPEYGNDGGAATRALRESERSILEAAAFLNAGKTNATDGSDDEDDMDQSSKTGGAHNRTAYKMGDLEDATQAALGEFDFLTQDQVSSNEQQQKSTTTKDAWKVDPSAINRMKEKYRSEQEQKRHDQSSSKTALNSMIRTLETDDTTKKLSENVTDGKSDQTDASNMMPYFGAHDINTALGIHPDEDAVDIRDDFALMDENTVLPKRWNLKYTLRSHWDAVRSMQFHPVEPVLVTVGEDGTAKLWNLAAKSSDTKSPQSSSSIVTELEPIYTFRGHRGPILTMDMSPTGDMCYTGGYDGTVRCWSIPSTTIDIYDKFDPKVLVETLKGHMDAVWSVAFHTSDNRLVSASADGTLKMWEPGNMEPLLRTYGPPKTDMIPTSVDFVSTEPQQLLVAYTPAHASILDLETGRSVLSFDFGSDECGRITHILSHPTMPVTVTAGEDRKIRYFDNNTGKLINGTVAHVEGISSLAIDPNGLYLLSGSHDGSLRLWNMEKRVCLQEIAAHRKKFDMSVMAVAFHPSRPLIGSAGADALAKVFG